MEILKELVYVIGIIFGITYILINLVSLVPTILSWKQDDSTRYSYDLFTNETKKKTAIEFSLTYAFIVVSITFSILTLLGLGDNLFLVLIVTYIVLALLLVIYVHFIGKKRREKVLTVKYKRDDIMKTWYLYGRTEDDGYIFCEDLSDAYSVPIRP